MFDKIGQKIKGLAKTICIIGIVLSVIAGVAMMAVGGGAGVISGLLFIAVGALLSWVSSFVLYGFGEIICKLSEIAENTKKNLE